MQDLQIATHTVAAAVHIENGACLMAQFHVAESPYQKSAPDDLASTLNDDRRFLPALVDLPQSGHRESILGKTTILWLQLTGSDLRWDPADPESHAAELTLSDGSQLRGHVDVDTPPQFSRILDKANRAPEFMTVLTEEGPAFVRTERIVAIEELAPADPKS